VCEQGGNPTELPAVEPRRGHLLEELRFAKRQQWAVATAVVTLLGALYGLAHSANSNLGVDEKEKVLFAVIVTLIATVGCNILASLQRHMWNSRFELEPRDRDALVRGSGIVGALMGVIILSAIGVLYVIALR
jgi:hypothetical protein